MKVCPKCKSTYNDEYSFCKKCGVALADVRKYTQPARPTGPVKENSSNGLLLTFVVVFAITLGCVGLYHFYGKMQALENQVQKQKVVINNNNRDLELQKSALEDQKRKAGNGLTTSYPKSNTIRNSAVVGAVHSSALVDGSYVYSADLAIDGNISSCWSEGVSGFGIGESIVINFDKTYKVHGINIWTGHQKSSELFYKNARPSSVRIITDLWKWDFPLEDRMGMQTCSFGLSTSTRSIKIIINDVYPGTKYLDTCIAEVSVF